MDMLINEVNLEDFPFVVDWPLHTGTARTDRKRFNWLKEVVGEENFVYDNGDFVTGDVRPRILFRFEADVVAYRLNFKDREVDEDVDYFSET